MRFIILIFIVVIGYMIFTNNMGGARDATDNYQKQLLGDKYSNSDKVESEQKAREE